MQTDGLLACHGSHAGLHILVDKPTRRMQYSPVLNAFNTAVSYRAARASHNPHMADLNKETTMPDRRFAQFSCYLWVLFVAIFLVALLPIPAAAANSAYVRVNQVGYETANAPFR